MKNEVMENIAIFMVTKTLDKKIPNLSDLAVQKAGEYGCKISNYPIYL